jgi:hypothetical protein
MAVAELEDLRIDGPSIDVERAGHRIWLIVGDLDIVRYKSEPVKRKVVSGTKALHHLLPNLVFPMDNEYTATFFGWHDFGTDPEHRFKFRQVAAIARTSPLKATSGKDGTPLSQKYLTTPSWAFAAPKA